MSKGFISDITPFMGGRKLTYVDVGANVGNVFAEFYSSALNIVEAYLFEPNNETFKQLQQKCDGKYQNTHLYNVALSFTQQESATLLLNGTMSKIIAAEEAAQQEAGKIQSVATTTLAEVATNFSTSHIDILKIDVEGHEIDVLKGAATLLANNSIDIIYLEAGLDPENTQQTYYRLLEDFLWEYNFRIFKIYEQMHEWPTDSPLLRRMNIAFMHKTFAEKHPYKQTQEIYATQKQLKGLSNSLKSMKADRK